MAMTILWTGMVCLSVLCGLATGRGEAVAAAVMEGAASAVELSLSLAGMLCLWSGVMEVLRQSGAAQRLSQALRPLLRPLFPGAAGEEEAMDAIAANVSANLLGLGNAATPLGLRAARCLSRGGHTAGDDLCMLVVCNTASLQLIPTTVAALRSAAGSAAPFEILPAVWLASALSVGAGICACKLLGRLWRGR